MKSCIWTLIIKVQVWIGLASANDMALPFPPSNIWFSRCCWLSKNYTVDGSSVFIFIRIWILPMIQWPLLAKSSFNYITVNSTMNKVKFQLIDTNFYQRHEPMKQIIKIFSGVHCQQRFMSFVYILFTTVLLFPSFKPVIALSKCLKMCFFSFAYRASVPEKSNKKAGLLEKLYDSTRII